MSIHKYRDWTSWWDGLRTTVLKSGFESLSTNVAVMLGSNGVASMVPAMHDYILTWHTAVVTTTAQFLLRSILAASDYIKTKPEADMIVETVDTTFVKKDTAGNQVSQSSSVVTTTVAATSPQPQQDKQT